MYREVKVRLLISFFSTIGYFIVLLIIKNVTVQSIIYGGLFIFVFTFLVNTLISRYMDNKRH